MTMKSTMRRIVAGALLPVVIAMCATAGTVSAEVYTCPANRDFFSNRCTVHANAITRVTNGMVNKGHLVGCQSKSFSCINGVCSDNFGTGTVPFTFSMDNLAGFCNLLCVNPKCTGTWQKQ